MLNRNKLILKYLGIDTHQDPIVYLRADCLICKSEGLYAQTRVVVHLNNRNITATLNVIQTNLLNPCEASLSNYAWNLLAAKPGDTITITHPQTLESINYIRSKIYGNELSFTQTDCIIKDIISGHLSDINIAMYIAASGGDRLSKTEILNLTRSMINTGQQLTWTAPLIVDKHSVGGLAGNRTTPIIVAIVAAYGLTIPKTSSRAITSPAGTADTMEVFANVSLDIPTIKKIVEQENGCIAWGGSIGISPADDLLIRIERTINLDSVGQMVASILSKKIAAGSKHIVIDIPIGPSAKVRSKNQANELKTLLQYIAEPFDIQVKSIFSDGTQPIGNGIGPALEARDVLAVLQNTANAPLDLKEKALTLAGELIDFCPKKPKNKTGFSIAKQILESGEALKKFEAICFQQNHKKCGIKEIPSAKLFHTIESTQSGIIKNINNQQLSMLAKLAGAPETKAAGVELLVKINSKIRHKQPLLKVHANTQGQLQYALEYYARNHPIFQIHPED